MANEMGYQELESQRNEPQERYRILKFRGNQIPKEFKNLIKAPFLNSLRYGNDLFKLIDKEVYYDVYSKYIDLLLSRDNSLVQIAILDDDTALGWSLSEKNIGWSISEINVLHYVWVKKEVRRQGIAKSLLPKEFDTISHVTRVGISIWAKNFKDVRLNPFV